MQDLHSVIDKLHASAKEAVEERTRAEILFSSIGDGAISTDELGNISRINQVALDMLGYKEKEVLGKPFFKIFKGCDEEGSAIDLLDRPITQAFVTGKPISCKAYYKHKEGHMLPVAITVSPIMLSGKPVGAIEVMRDITIEHEIDRMKSEFLSLASHQLRTPLTAVKTYAHLLANDYAGKLNSTQRKFLDIVLSSADHMNMLIDTFLDISRIESGKLKVDPQDVSIKKLANEVLREFAGPTTEKDIKLSVSFGKLPKTLYTDPLLMREVFANLISNAIKYTPPNGHIQLRLEEKNNNLIFSIQDSGYGIPASQKNRIFDKFFRASNVLTQDTSGSGLGLYMIKRIAERMGGDIRFRSREGHGSTFYFIIPKEGIKSFMS